ncbi:hypothetical protein HELRODRAFT_173904 [Helobdella robusta]|uniref:Endonuclease/exonuclease/phosphatase domain-containing protein n=1 Tax=Helobdella robusta TaxID=6412 RepID=T1F7C6_HELRO|nr:hypothetical protein HELRODRAFT_173904 [Helobdella robusta]ESO03038.1 hypothetical protein HELRODRAFT_173904 [Helobdella robusta]
MEITKMIERRKIDICCLQETRWKSNGVCHVNSDKEKYKLFWNGQKTAEYGVGIFVKTASPRSCVDTISTIPKSETIVIGGDLNGHVGEKTDGFDNVHGGFGYGERNEDGNRILEFAESHGFFYWTHILERALNLNENFNSFPKCHLFENENDFVRNISNPIETSETYK